MEKYITEERTGLKYELVGDYYLIAGEDELEEKTIGIWGQRRLRYLKEHRQALYTALLLSDRLNGYLADVDQQAEDMFYRLVKQMAQRHGITETLKVSDQMLWVRQMNNIRCAAREIILQELILE
jgi:hypothetical protein